jgi:hypothetical protein
MNAALTSRLINLLFYAISLAWVLAIGHLMTNADWAGAIICMVGLLGTLLIVISLRSRSQRSMYSDRYSDSL